MRYQLELEMDVPRERVLELFLDTENLARWQPSLVEYEPLGDGDELAVGARSRQLHRMGSREVEMIQTITVHDHPDRFSATYEAGGVWNLVENQFVDLDGTRTRWILGSEFRCTGFMRVMTFLMPGSFKKQSLDFMNYFKDFAEGSGS